MKEANEMVRDEVVERMRSFSILKWCGMPQQLNPRKLAKKGFKCIEKCILQCTDEQNCAQKVQLQQSLQFSDGVGDETSHILKRACYQLENCHTPECRFRKDQYKPCVSDWSTFLSQDYALSGGLSSRSSLYLYTNDIYQALQSSYDEETRNFVKFNLALAIDKLSKIYG